MIISYKYVAIAIFIAIIHINSYSHKTDLASALDSVALVV